VVAFGLALLLSLDKRQRHDLYLIASALVRHNPRNPGMSQFDKIA
jgi:hypothetical protein